MTWAKPALAQQVVSQITEEDIEDRFDLDDQVKRVCNQIRLWNQLQATPLFDFAFDSP